MRVQDGKHMDDNGRPAEAPQSTSRSSRLVLAIRFLLLAAAVVLGVYAIARDADGFVSAVTDIGTLRAFAAFLCIGAGLLASAETWRTAVAATSGPVPRRAGRQVFFVTQLGKYLPGAVWTVVGQVDAAKRLSLSRSHMALGAVLFIVLHVLTGLLVAALLLPVTAPDVMRTYTWAFALVPLLLVAMLPRVLSRTMDVALRVVGQARLSAPLGARDVLVPSAWLLLTWSAFGLALTIVAEPLAAHTGFVQLIGISTGAFGLAWAVGVLVVPAPAGVGVREVVLFLALAPILGATEATSVAILTRVLHTAADLGLPMAVTLTHALPARRRVHVTPRTRRRRR